VYLVALANGTAMGGGVGHSVSSPHMLNLMFASLCVYGKRHGPVTKYVCYCSDASVQCFPQHGQGIVLAEHWSNMMLCSSPMIVLSECVCGYLLCSVCVQLPFQFTVSGLLAVCDCVVAKKSAMFALSEVGNNISRPILTIATMIMDGTIQHIE